MTQSGVSQHIRKLEEQLGVDLLIRDGKQFVLSAAGERLYSEAPSILRALSNLQQRVADDPAYEGTVRIMSPGSVGLKLYPHLLVLQAKHPKLIIDFRFAPNTEVEVAIEEGAVDIGLMTMKSQFAEVSCQALATEPLLLVTPANIQSPCWEDLIELGLIGHPDVSHHAHLLLGENFSEFQHSKLIPKKGFSNQIALILEPVSLGLGFTVLPAHAVSAFPKPELIQTHRLDNPVSETLFLCLQRNRVIPNRVKTVLDEISHYL